MKYSDKLIMIVTKECNRKCKFCIDTPNRKYYTAEQKYIDMPTVDKILDFATTHQIKTIALNGGEPTLHPDIVTIAKKIKARGFRSKIFTNYDHPKIVKQLDGIVDTIRISYYQPMTLPRQKDFQSQLTLKILLNAENFPTLASLTNFIKKVRPDFTDIKIHTMMQNNAFSMHHQVPFLQELTTKYPLQRNDKGDYYHKFMGLQIEREDLPNLDYEIEQRIYKAHMDGTITHYFEEDYHQLGGLDQRAPLTKALRAHRNQTYRANVMQAYHENNLDFNNLDNYLKL